MNACQITEERTLSSNFLSQKETKIFQKNHPTLFKKLETLPAYKLKHIHEHAY